MLSPSETMSSSPAITVRRMSASDASFAQAILKESPEASIWSVESLQESVSQGIAWAAELDGRFAGILIGRIAADEFEILNLAVREPFRRQGIATQLVRCALEFVQAGGARQAFLEVRASNEGAIAFYERLGFRHCGRRPNYYRDPVEDARVMVMQQDETIS